LKVVFNTSPIIFLYKLGYLELARNLFDGLYERLKRIKFRVKRDIFNRIFE